MEDMELLLSQMAKKEYSTIFTAITGAVRGGNRAKR